MRPELESDLEFDIREAAELLAKTMIFLSKTEVARLASEYDADSDEIDSRLWCAFIDRHEELI